MKSEKNGARTPRTLWAIIRPLVLGLGEMGTTAVFSAEERHELMGFEKISLIAVLS